jgi:hypothetical protein
MYVGLRSLRPGELRPGQGFKVTEFIYRSIGFSRYPRIHASFPNIYIYIYIK